MKFDLFINFDGECREAVAFYARVFQSEVRDLMTYGTMPPDPGFPVAAADVDKIAYCCVPIFGCNVMFTDTPSGMPFVKGNNLSPTLSADSADEITRIFNELKEGGTVDMPLQKTFWSDLYGCVTDRYGVIWQLSCEGTETK